jgi:TatD DNase family protein
VPVVDFVGQAYANARAVFGPIIPAAGVI